MAELALLEAVMEQLPPIVEQDEATLRYLAKRIITNPISFGVLANAEHLLVENDGPITNG